MSVTLSQHQTEGSLLFLHITRFPQLVMPRITLQMVKFSPRLISWAVVLVVCLLLFGLSFVQIRASLLSYIFSTCYFLFSSFFFVHFITSCILPVSLIDLLICLSLRVILIIHLNTLVSVAFLFYFTLFVSILAPVALYQIGCTMALFINKLSPSVPLSFIPEYPVLPFVFCVCISPIRSR